MVDYNKKELRKKFAKYELGCIVEYINNNTKETVDMLFKTILSNIGIVFISPLFFMGMFGLSYFHYVGIFAILYKLYVAINNRKFDKMIRDYYYSSIMGKSDEDIRRDDIKETFVLNKQFDLFGREIDSVLNKNNNKGE